MQGEHASDPWAPDGKLRALLRIATALASVGTHVFRPVGGGVVPARRFVDEVGDLDDAENRPMGALVDLVPADGATCTAGMALAGLPEVMAPGEDGATHDALLAAVAFMARANRALAAGDRIRSGSATYTARGEDDDGIIEIVRAG